MPFKVVHPFLLHRMCFVVHTAPGTVTGKETFKFKQLNVQMWYSLLGEMDPGVKYSPLHSHLLIYFIIICLCASECVCVKEKDLGFSQTLLPLKDISFAFKSSS